MRLYHVSEEGGISVFFPRKPSRPDLDPEIGLVWALEERCLPNFLVPRDCPRVTYHLPPGMEADPRFFSSRTSRHVVAVEWDWFQAMRDVTLYLYEFYPDSFVLQDAAAGYYVSTRAETPVSVTVVPDVFAALSARNVELRVVDNLWELCRAVQETAMHWSMCRMRNAKPPEGKFPLEGI